MSPYLLGIRSAAPAWLPGCPPLSWQVLLHSPDSIAPVGILHPTAFHIQQKQGAPTNSSTEAGAASSSPGAGIPPAQVTEVPQHWLPEPKVPEPAGGSSTSASTNSWDIKLSSAPSTHHLHLMCSAVRAAPASTVEWFTAADTAAALGCALSAVAAALPAAGVGWDDSCFVHLYLSDMQHFGAANEEYCKHLPAVNPPSRACVQVKAGGSCHGCLCATLTKQHVMLVVGCPRAAS